MTKTTRRNFMQFGMSALAGSLIAGSSDSVEASPLKFYTYQLGAFRNDSEASALVEDLKEKKLNAAAYPDEDYVRVAVPTFHPRDVLVRKTGIEDLFLYKDRRYLATAEAFQGAVREITPEGLVSLTYVLNGEVTNTPNKAEQIKDLQAITHNIMNRLFAAIQDKELRKDYTDGPTTLEGVLHKRNQYSAMNSGVIKAKIAESLRNKNMIRGIKEVPELERFMLCFDVARKTIGNIIVNPWNDPTSGSLMYLNESISRDRNGNSIDWNGKTVYGRTRKKTSQLGEHTYYALVNKSGTNLGTNHRLAYFGLL